MRSCRVLNNLDEEEVDDIQSQNEFSFSSSGYSLYSASDEWILYFMFIGMNNLYNEVDDI